MNKPTLKEMVEQRDLLFLELGVLVDLIQTGRQSPKMSVYRAELYENRKVELLKLETRIILALSRTFRKRAYFYPQRER